MTIGTQLAIAIGQRIEICKDCLKVAVGAKQATAIRKGSVQRLGTCPRCHTTKTVYTVTA